MLPEYYFSCHAPSAASVHDAITDLYKKFINNLSELNVSTNSVIMVRFFCSDVYTQAPFLDAQWPTDGAYQRVYIGQSPQDSAFISIQAYGIKGNISKKQNPDGVLSVLHGSYESLWSIDYPPTAASSLSQTDAIIASLQKKLTSRGLLLEENVIRTWYYVRDVDNNYAGMVASRLAHYEACGLLPSTHFIASTGIEANAPRPDVLTWMQSYAEKGVVPEQITFLKALDHLSPTHVYGVNFERATRVTYGDCAHCHLSGTASIDGEGNVLHKGNVLKQFERAAENVEALLLEGGMKLDDLNVATIYLRDSHDYPRMADAAKTILPKGCAVNITHGPICRPDWLMEMEGEAIMTCKTHYPTFI